MLAATACGPPDVEERLHCRIAGDGTSEITFERPGRILWALDAGMFQARMCMDGDEGWSDFMAPPGRIRGPMRKAMLEWLNHYDLLLLRPLLGREDVRALFRAEIDAACAGLRPFERVRGWCFVPPFEVGRELTATLKKRRSKIAEIYAGKIARITR